MTKTKRRNACVRIFSVDITVQFCSFGHVGELNDAHSLRIRLSENELARRVLKEHSTAGLLHDSHLLSLHLSSKKLLLLLLHLQLLNQGARRVAHRWPNDLDELTVVLNELRLLLLLLLLRLQQLRRGIFNEVLNTT
jgi:hypothetical protein